MFHLLFALRPASGEAIARRRSQGVSEKSIAVNAGFVNPVLSRNNYLRLVSTAVVEAARDSLFIGPG
jgi:hypothetical protein